jgi:S1-C subfamily serine protease
VVIVEVAAGSTAAAAGFRRGDVLLGINGERVKTAADVDRATQNPTRLWRFNFVRDRQQIQAVFGG